MKGPPDPCLFCQHGQIVLPVVCCLYIACLSPPPPPLSLLLFADVQIFCSEKESLFVTLESFKEKDTTRLSPSFTIRPTKTTDAYLHAAASALHRAGRLLHGRPWKLQISFVVVIMEADTNIDLEK